MLRFAVYDDSGKATDWPLTGAHLIGRDDLPIPGSVKFRDGNIVCRPQGNRVAGLVLVHDVGAMGRLMLQTCLLPERDQPYLLSVELARHRIKTFIVKSEEWQMFDLSAEHPAMRLWEEARQLLTRALTTEDPLAADRAARRSLEKGIEATERLTLAHAEILLHRRYGQRRASSTTLGVRVNPMRDGAGLRELLARDFDVLVVPTPWRDLEVEEGKYNWEPTDRWLQWAKKQGKPVVAGPLLDFSRAAVPDWMYVWQHDYDTCRDLVYDHVERVVQRYQGVVNFWNLGAGLNVNDNFTFTPEQMVDLVRMAGLILRQARKGSRQMVELAHPYGEHGATKESSLHPIVFAERLIQEGIRLDALGLRLVFGDASSGGAARDLMQISNLLDRLYFLEVPVLITAAGVPSDAADEDAGWWHGPWSPEIQASWASQLFAVALARPYVESLIWADIVDTKGSLAPSVGLISDAGSIKPALSKLVHFRKRLRKPLGPLRLPSRAGMKVDPPAK